MDAGKEQARTDEDPDVQAKVEQYLNDHALQVVWYLDK